MSNNSYTKVKTNIFTVQNDTSTAIISAANVRAGNLIVENQFQVANSKTKYFHSSHNEACGANNRILLGRYTIQGNSHNFVIKGNYSGQTDEKAATVDFVLYGTSGSTTNDIAENLILTSTTSHVNRSADIDAYIYTDTAPGYIDIVATNTASIENASWNIEVLERQDYNGWESATFYTNSDFTPAGTKSLNKSIGVITRTNNKTGINTFEPTHTLSVSGDVISTTGKYYSNTTNHIEISPDNNTFKFINNSGTQVTVASDGKTGIGDEAPGEKLVVAGNIQPTGNIVRKSNTNTTGFYQNTTENDSAGYITFNNNGPGSNLGYTTVAGRRIEFKNDSTSSSAGTTIVSITGGKVGIDEINPLDVLHVKGDARVTSQLKVLNDNANDTFTNIGAVGIKSDNIFLSTHNNTGTRTGFISGSNSDIAIGTDGTGALSLNTNGNNPRVTITSAGDVGINTTTFNNGAKLAVNGGVNITNEVTAAGGVFGGFLSLTDSGTDKRGVRGRAGTNDHWYIGGAATATDAGYLEIATGDNASEPIYVRQYSEPPTSSTSPARTLTLLDSNGKTLLPNSLHINKTTVSPYILETDNTTLSNTVGSVASSIRLQTHSNGSAGNDMFLKVFAERHTAGTSWEGVKFRLQHQVDTTDMGYIDFNPNNGGKSLSLGTNNTSRLFISHGGNIALNETTTSPNASLQIGTNGNVPTLFLDRTTNYASISGNTNVIIDSNTDVRLNNYSNKNVIIAKGGGNTYIGSDGAGAAADAKVQISGKTYINSDTVISQILTANKLYLSAGSGQIKFTNNQLDIDDVDTDDGNESNVRFFRSTNHNGSKSLLLFRGDGTTAHVDAQIGVSSVNTFFSIPEGTKTGIGTRNPQEKLHVVGDVKITGNIVGNNNNLMRILTNTSTQNSLGWIALADTDNNTNIGGSSVQIYTGSTAGATGSVAIYADSGQNVGINTTTLDGYRLNVNGTFKSNSINTGNIVSTGSVQATSELQGSELRLGGTDVTITKGTNNAMIFKDASTSGVYLSALSSPSLDTSNLVAPNMIVLWSGNIADIPTGWRLCNGEYGTPDLRGRFVIGRSKSSDPATFYREGCTNTGGCNSITLTTGNLPCHNHPAGTLVASCTGGHVHCISGNTNTDGLHHHRNYVAWPWTISSFFQSELDGYGQGQLTPFIGTSTTCRGDFVYGINFCCAVCSQYCSYAAGYGNTGSGHSHAIAFNSTSSGGHCHVISGCTGNTGSGTAINSTPAYYHLAYIMRTNTTTP